MVKQVYSLSEQKGCKILQANAGLRYVGGKQTRIMLWQVKIYIQSIRVKLGDMMHCCSCYLYQICFYLNGRPMEWTFVRGINVKAFGYRKTKIFTRTSSTSLTRK